MSSTPQSLAGVPSIVYGLLGLAVFVVALGEIVGPGAASGRSLIAGGLTMAILVLPLVIITSAEALRAVPAAIREAAFGVGATRWEVVRSHGGRLRARRAHAALSSAATTFRGRHPVPSGSACPVPNQPPAAS